MSAGTTSGSRCRNEPETNPYLVAIGYSFDTVDAFPRDVLLRYRWTDGHDLSTLEVSYVSRGAPDDTAIVSGSEITGVGRGSFSMGDTEIPYHRVIEISDRGELVFSRPASAPGRQTR